MCLPFSDDPSSPSSSSSYTFLVVVDVLLFCHRLHTFLTIPCASLTRYSLLPLVLDFRSSVDDPWVAQPLICLILVFSPSLSFGFEAEADPILVVLLLSILNPHKITSYMLVDDDKDDDERDWKVKAAQFSFSSFFSFFDFTFSYQMSK